MVTESELHVFARMVVERWKAGRLLLNGKIVTFDKKQLRFNDIVAVGLHYQKCGDPNPHDLGYFGVMEAIEACIIGHMSHVPNGTVLTMIKPWMEYNEAA